MSFATSRARDGRRRRKHLGVILVESGPAVRLEIIRIRLPNDEVNGLRLASYEMFTPRAHGFSYSFPGLGTRWDLSFKRFL